MSKEVLKAVKAHLEAAGIKPLVTLTGTGHYRIAVQMGDAVPFIIIPSTASCSRAMKNAVAQARRTFGVSTACAKSSRPKHHRATAKPSPDRYFIRATEPAVNRSQSLADQLSSLSLRLA
jgi:hypothetical protein